MNQPRLSPTQINPAHHMELSRIQHLKLNRNLQSSNMLANLCNKPTRVTTYLLFGKMHHRNNPATIIK